MITFRNRSVAATGAVIATIATCLAVSAPARAETNSVAVSYADLNLDHAAGRAALDRRIQAAATTVCGEAQAYDRFQVSACRAKAIDAARTAASHVGTKVASR